MKSVSIVVPGFLLALALLSLASTAYLSRSGCNRDHGFAENTLYATAEELEIDNDTFNATTKVQVNLLGQLYEGLVRLDPQTLEVRPGLAERWEISKDGRIYDFFLRDGLKWCDGTPLGPEDFVAAAKRILKPDLKVHRMRVHLQLKGARDYKERRITRFEEVGISIPAPGHLRFELECPTPQFLIDLAGPSGWPNPPRNIRGPLASTIGNGPFYVEAASPERLILRRNPHYWAKGLPALERIVLTLLSSESSLEPLRFDAGNVHISSGIAGWVADRLKDRRELVVGQVFSTFYLRFDTSLAPLDDPRLRLALSLAIDRERLAQLRRDPPGFVGWTFVPPLVPDYPRAMILKDRRAEARILLAQHLADRGSPLPPLTVHFGFGDESRQAAIEVARSWREVLGIAADVMSEGKEGKKSDRKPGISLVGLAGSLLDPANLLGAFDKSAGMLSPGWDNSDFMKKFDAAKKAQNKQERLRLLMEAEQILLQEAPIAPLFFGRSIHLVHPRVKGWQVNALDIWSFRELRFE